MQLQTYAPARFDGELWDRGARVGAEAGEDAAAGEGVVVPGGGAAAGGEAAPEERMRCTDPVLAEPIS
jgi:hypothetical protein